ncbi:peptidyl-prolyl cis-trans isomerase-like isoform X2 [Palaemon carinicauda]|uniref:peptidyl-prolyl cis-trans isomerase-like isoform X2 n=1 Tax=Palaemon carinicauda TaxID=392227 RepID=UPI0035B60F5C
MARDLLEIGGPLKQQIERGSVYCVHQVASEPKYGRVSLSNGKLCIHRMEDCQIPDDACIVNYEEARTLVDPSSRQTFLELGTNGATLGRLIIRLSPDTKGAEQFALICAGEKGVSYANTKLFQVHHRGKIYEYVGGGDYEYNNGDGGKALVAGLELGPEYERPWVAGTVRGFWGLGSSVSAQFFISTHDHPAGVCSPAFGIVEEGLEILTNAVQCSTDITEVYVQDCGIILNS